MAAGTSDRLEGALLGRVKRQYRDVWCLLAGLVASALPQTGGAAQGQAQATPQASRQSDASERDFCADRPGLDTPACTLETGRVAIEFGLIDWTRSKDSQEIENRYVTGDVLLRYGIADHAEVQVGWQAYGKVRVRDRTGDSVAKDHGTGDVTMALRRNVQNPDGSGLSLALMPYVTLPLGKTPVGDGDWSAGVLIPLSYELSDSLSLVSTAELQADVDEDGKGRHFAFTQVAGLAADLSDSVNVSLQYELALDRSRDNRHAEHRADLSLAWQPQDNWQWDIGSSIGLDRDAPDMRAYMGISRRF